MTRVQKFFLMALFSLSMAFSVPGFAQSASKSGGTSPYDTRNTVGVILLSGLVGGVLGLSTLSFYDRPQDHIRNITLGAGIGVIASALFMTAAVATTPPPTASTLDWNLYPIFDPQEAAAALSFNLKF